MKIYYATSIRGEISPDASENNRMLITELKKHGTVLTEHFADESILAKGEEEISDEDIHDRDMEWIKNSDVIVAEISNLSLGVGYELGRSVELNKKILCLRKKSDKRLSAMIKGCRDIKVFDYKDISEALNYINLYFRNLKI